ncbi:Hypothetical predicted protein [Cloeon dipterum]|uniref:Secreted protein n=1 Tax=Cloeon dipterum TaxID=197152 RepID=A0A8S1BRQ5_9INSE|nr:Hypothetical predicted protein [Cloeon dipterum]
MLPLSVLYSTVCLLACRGQRGPLNRTAGSSHPPPKKEGEHTAKAWVPGPTKTTQAEPCHPSRVVSSPSCAKHPPRR